MDNDDATIGRILSRREMLALLGSAGAAVLVGCSDNDSPAASTSQATGPTDTVAAGASPSIGAASTTAGAATATATAIPACVVTPALTEGPYFVDEKLNRADIRSDPTNSAVKAGTPLALTFVVQRVAGGQCAPLANATVDVWHCDAAGVYSDASDPGFNTKGQKFLRGYQVTDAAGKAAFNTIYPGWYQGRAVHIHFKVRGLRADGKSFDFTSQLFFDEAVTDVVHAQQPYAAKGRRTLLNAGDGIWRESNGQLQLNAVKSTDGYAGTFVIGVSGV